MAKSMPGAGFEPARSCEQPDFKSNRPLGTNPEARAIGSASVSPNLSRLLRDDTIRDTVAWLLMVAAYGVLVACLATGRPWLALPASCLVAAGLAVLPPIRARVEREEEA